jgi:hypothetical protein
MRLRHLLGLSCDPPEISAWSCQGEVQDPRLEDEKKAFKVMREAYMLSRRAAVRVLEATSSGGAHFAQQASLAAAEALALSDRVADWLQCAALCTGHCVAGFIVVLDDIDLARNSFLDMVYSLLDELHQPRLILVIGADLPTLERRLADLLAGGRLDRLHLCVESGPRHRPEAMRMANDLLYKVLPQVNREQLLPWTEDERWFFPPRPTTAYSLDFSLGDLLVDRTSDWLSYLNPALLPGYPRHLENLWHGLALSLEGTTEGDSEHQGLDDLGRFIAYLSEARGDYGLARRVVMRAPDCWGRTFMWEEEPIARGVWDRLVDAALENRPLSGLVTKSDDLPLPQAPASAALWIELLLDLSLSSGQLTSADLIRRFPRMAALFKEAQIRTDFHRDEMAEQLRNARGSVMAELAWTHFEVSPDRQGVLPEIFDARVGIRPLHRALAGRRKAWHTILAQGLYLRRSEVLDERQQAYATKGDPDDADALLPRGVRPLIVFVDSLSRAPWRLLSETPRRRSLRTNALLAAGLVRAVYYDALERVFDAMVGRGKVKKTAKLKLSKADNTWLDAIHDREHMPIVEWSDDGVEDQFHALPAEKPYRKLDARDLPGGQAKPIDWKLGFFSYNALVDCLNAYTRSRAFRHLADPSFDRKHQG